MFQVIKKCKETVIRSDRTDAIHSDAHNKTEVILVDNVEWTNLICYLFSK